MKNHIRIILFVFIGLAIVSCSESEKVNNISSEVIKHKYFPELSSASGIEFIDVHIKFVGDDLPYLFTLDDQWNVIGKEKISGIDSIVNGRTPKSLKADFESIGLLKKNKKSYLLILSSGSESVTRDTAFLVSLQGDKAIINKNMRPLYDVIKQEADLETTNEINIEGLAFSPQKAYLFHRGNVSELSLIHI